VLGLGSAKDGTGHWWSQRVSAVALALLTAWFVLSLLALDDLGFGAVTAWIREPFNTVLLMLLVATLFYHSFLGVEVVIEDYVHEGGTKIVALVAAKFAHFLLAAAGLVAVLRVSFGA
jgi:succinate dehydrogenase / fumarate reductase membrane anchor subunit